MEQASVQGGDPDFLSGKETGYITYSYMRLPVDRPEAASRGVLTDRAKDFLTVGEVFPDPVARLAVRMTARRRRILLADVINWAFIQGGSCE